MDVRMNEQISARQDGGKNRKTDKATSVSPGTYVGVRVP